MNRKSFFKKIGIGIAAIVVAPKVIASTSAKDHAIALDSKVTYGICYWPPYSVAKVYDEVAPKKSYLKRYRVIGIKDGDVFLCHFTDKYAKLPFNLSEDAFYKNFMQILRPEK